MDVVTSFCLVSAIRMTEVVPLEDGDSTILSGWFLAWSGLSPPKWPSTSLFDNFFIWQTLHGFKTKYISKSL